LLSTQACSQKRSRSSRQGGRESRRNENLSGQELNKLLDSVCNTTGISCHETSFLLLVRWIDGWGSRRSTQWDCQSIRNLSAGIYEVNLHRLEGRSPPSVMFLGNTRGAMALPAAICPHSRVRLTVRSLVGRVPVYTLQRASLRYILRLSRCERIIHFTLINQRCAIRQ
jgi:hypothetical protein